MDYLTFVLTVHSAQVFLAAIWILSVKGSTMDDVIPMEEDARPRNGIQPQQCSCCARGDPGPQGSTGVPGIQGLPGCQVLKKKLETNLKHLRLTFWQMPAVSCTEGLKKYFVLHYLCFKWHLDRTSAK